MRSGLDSGFVAVIFFLLIFILPFSDSFFLFLFFLWFVVCTSTLCFNLISLLAYFCVDTTNGSGFGLAILWAILFTPCSFVCWYRPVYKAFRCVPPSHADYILVVMSLHLLGDVKLGHTFFLSLP